MRFRFKMTATALLFCHRAVLSSCSSMVHVCSATEYEPAVVASPPCHLARRNPKPRFPCELDGIARVELAPFGAQDCDFLGILSPLGNRDPLPTISVAAHARRDSLSSPLDRSDALRVGPRLDGSPAPRDGYRRRRSHASGHAL